MGSKSSYMKGYLIESNDYVDQCLKDKLAVMQFKMLDIMERPLENSTWIKSMVKHCELIFKTEDRVLYLQISFNNNANRVDIKLLDSEQYIRYKQIPQLCIQQTLKLNQLGIVICEEAKRIARKEYRLVTNNCHQSANTLIDVLGAKTID